MRLLICVFDIFDGDVVGNYCFGLVEMVVCVGWNLCMYV